MSNGYGYSFHLSFIASGVNCWYVYSRSRCGGRYVADICNVQQFNIISIASLIKSTNCIFKLLFFCILHRTFFLIILFSWFRVCCCCLIPIHSKIFSQGKLTCFVMVKETDFCEKLLSDQRCQGRRWFSDQVCVKQQQLLISTTDFSRLEIQIFPHTKYRWKVITHENSFQLSIESEKIFSFLKSHFIWKWIIRL